MALNTDLYDLLQPIITGTVIWADQNAPRPASPYTTIKIASLRQVNHDHYGEPNNSGIQTVKGDREFTLSIQSYGREGVTFLNDVAGKLKLTTNQDKFMAKKITCFNIGQVADVSAVIGSVIEKRASLDIFCRIKSSLTDNVGLIETVTANATDNSDAGGYVVSVSL